MNRFLEETATQAAAVGYSGLRTAGEMSWALDAGISLERVMEYEAQLSGFFATNPVVLLCHYDRGRFTAEAVQSALRTHPAVVAGSDVLGNPFTRPRGSFWTTRQVRAGRASTG